MSNEKREQNAGEKSAVTQIAPRTTLAVSKTTLVVTTTPRVNLLGSASK